MKRCEDKRRAASARTGKRYTRRTQRADTAKGPSLKQRLSAWWGKQKENLLQDEWIRSLWEKRSTQRGSGLESLCRRRRSQQLQEEAAAMKTVRDKVRFALRHHKVVATASAGLALAILCGGVGLGANYLASQKSVTLCIGETRHACVTTADTVGEFLLEKQLFLGNGDMVTPARDSLLETGMEIHLYPQLSVVILVDEAKKLCFLNQGTVADALAAADVTLGELDKVEPGTATALTDGMTVRVTRVATNTIVMKERLYYDTKYVEDKGRYIGNDKVVQQGKEGELVRTVVVTYEDGLEVSREVVSEEKPSLARNELVLKGVKPTPTPTPKPTPKPTPTPTPKSKTTKTPEKTQKPSTTSTKKPTTTKTPSKTKKPTATATPTPKKNTIPGTPDTYEKTLSMMVTAYTHTGEQTALSTWPQATRTRSNPGTVAVAPQTIPYHTLLYVPGYGYCLAEDTGGFRHDRPYQIDVFMDTETECQKWGRKRDYTVYIVEYDYYR